MAAVSVLHAHAGPCFSSRACYIYALLVQYAILILMGAVSRLYMCVQSAPVPAPERDFLINGWRWHTRAAVREAGRLRHVALSARTSDAKSAMPARLAKCYSYVWSFVFVKLHMIEIDIFFPWLRQNLPSEVCSSMPSIKHCETLRTLLAVA
jgi:hypothetical protein